jgi:hypothetical protein
MGKLNHAWVNASIEQADNERAKISERERELFGLSSLRLKCLVNNLCAAEKTNYLEIGVYKGATIISAVMGNDVKAVGVDNFQYDEREPKRWAPEGFIWDNVKSQLEANIKRYDNHPETKIPGSINLIQSSFEEVDWVKQPKFNVVLFDISPINQKVYDDFFDNVLVALAQESVVVFTGQSNAQHAEELNKSLIRHNDKIEVQYSEIRVSGGMADASKYYSGIRIIGFKKKAGSFIKKPATPTSNTAAK